MTINPLLPAFDETNTLFDTAAWVTSTGAGASSKFADPFDFGPPAGTSLSSHGMGEDFEALFGLKMPSPTLPEAQVFDTGLGQLAAHNGHAMSMHSGNGNLSNTKGPGANGLGGHSFSSDVKSSSRHQLDTKTDANALQLEITDSHSYTLVTPSQSPRAPVSGLSSGYASPAFQLSPTPGLTMCPTVHSTPAPRSNSRCSSRSSFSHHETERATALAAIINPMPSAAAASSRTTASTATAAGTKAKKLHLCPYANCPRSERTFRSNADLQRHIRSHRGERPYTCPSPGCGKAYGQQNKMVNHVKMQHPSLLSLVDTGRSRRRASAATATSVSRQASVAAASAVKSFRSAPTTPAATSAAHMATPSVPGSATSSAVSTPLTTASLSIRQPTARPAPYNIPTSARALALAQQTPNSTLSASGHGSMSPAGDDSRSPSKSHTTTASSGVGPQRGPTFQPYFW